MTVPIQDDRRYRVDLTAYMDTCDSNYRRLLHLIPALESVRPSRAMRAGRLDCRERRDHLGRDRLESPSKETQKLAGQHWRFTLAGTSDERQAAELHAMKVDIRVLESFAYTTTLEIVVSSGFPAWALAPRIQVRLYHDADTAEPLSYQGHRRIPARSTVPNARMYHQDEKRQVNEFLAEWLELCLRSGTRTQAPDILCIT